MRIKTSHRWALLAAVGVVATTVGAARSAATPTYAYPLGTPIAGGFHEVALQGFGQRANSWPWSMEFYRDRLYVGTNRNYDCTLSAIIVNATNLPFLYPPHGPNISCPTPLAALPPTEGGQIWALNLSAPQPYTQSDWQMVYDSPLTVPITVPGGAASLGPRDMAFRGMSVFSDGDPNGPALYVSGVDIKPITKSSVPPPSLLRTTVGLAGTFKPVPANPGTTMGDINTLPTIPNSQGSGACCLRGETSMTDTAGVNHFLLLIGTIQGAGAVFGATHPQGGDNNFVQLTPPSMPVFELAPFNGHLYLGIQSGNNGYSVVWTDCLTPPPGQPWCPASDFHQVVPPGGGLGSSSGNFTVTSMHVFTTTEIVTTTGGTTTTIQVPHLYVGTDGAPHEMPTEIVRVNPDNSWDLVVGNARTVNGVLKSPLSGLPQGFGWYFNWHMWRMADYEGVLYVGTFDASTMYLNAAQQQQYAPYIGFDLWASTDGIHFQPVTLNGFGDPLTFGARTLKGTPSNGFFVGGANYYYGLRIYQGTLSSSMFALAPANMQATLVDRSGAVALAWNAPQSATLYHVYRARMTQQAAPAEPARRDNPELFGATGHLPRMIWMPSPYAEIGTTTAPYYVDHTAQAGGRYSYYVVAQDAAGTLSLPSNAETTPSLAPTVGFHSVVALLVGEAAHGTLSHAQAVSAYRALLVAYLRLHAGDAQGSASALDALQQQALAGAHGPVGALDAERMVQLLAQLRTRLTLVNAHVLPASQLR